MSLPYGTDTPERPARQLVAYFALTYGLTWGAILAYLATLSFDFAALRTEQLMVMLVIMLAGPPIAGLALIAAFDGRDGFADLFLRLRRVGVDPRWYAFALLPIPVLLLVVLLPLSALVSPDYRPTFLAFGIAAGLLAGFFEEIGWTGFATPRLLERFSPLRAGLILGLVWAFWHALADFSGNAAAMGPAEWAIRMVVSWIVPLTCYRVLMTLAYAHHRSLALAMLMHAGYTGWLATFTMEMPAATGPGALLWQAPFMVLIVTLTVAVALLARRSGHGAAAASPPYAIRGGARVHGR
jgi:uncharacterized protein